MLRLRRFRFQGSTYLSSKVVSGLAVEHLKSVVVSNDLRRCHQFVERLLMSKASRNAIGTSLALAGRID
jgi:hypothetical protein